MGEVEFTRDGAVQTITLNRPDKLNAFTRAVHDGLQEALRGGGVARRCAQSCSPARAVASRPARI